MKCEKCRRRCPGHKWGRIKAQEEGWFFTKDEKAYCPAHVPEWVEEWRKRKSESSETS